jgi:hypothetical protein
MVSQVDKAFVRLRLSSKGKATDESSYEKSLREMSSAFCARALESWKTDGNSVVLLRKVHGYICMWRLRAAKKW